MDAYLDKTTPSKYKSVPLEAKEFAMRCIALVRAPHRWPRTRCLEKLKSLAPDVFGHLHCDTVRHRSPAKSTGAVVSRPLMLPRGALLRICEHMQEILRDDFNAVVNKELNKLHLGAKNEQDVGSRSAAGHELHFREGETL